LDAIIEEVNKALKDTYSTCANPKTMGNSSKKLH